MWLYIPPGGTFTESAFAPEAEAWTSLCPSRVQAFAQSVTWRGKHAPPPLWRLRWTRNAWLRRLFGRMPEPSQAAAFVEAWTSFLAESHASRIASPGSVSELMTSATYGQPPAGSSSRPAHGDSSWRTSADSSQTQAPGGFTETWSDWVSRLREDFSRRRKSAPRRNGSAFSSSQSPDIPGNLPLFPDHWPTLMARDHRSLYAGPETMGKNARPLTEFVGMWATIKGTIAGPDFAKLERSSTGLALPAQAALWQTLTVADTEGGRLSRSGPRRDEPLLRGQAKVLASRLDLEPLTNGATSPPSGRVLSPWFCERLMGWPTGWTGFVFSAMGLYHYRRRLRSELLRFDLPPAPPAQLSLFG